MFPRSSFLYKWSVALFILIVLMYSFLIQKTTRSLSHNFRERDSQIVQETRSTRAANEIYRTTQYDVKNSSFPGWTSTVPPIVNPHDFNYILNPVNMCTGKDVYFIVYIHTSPTNFRKRQTIRHTWGDPHLLKIYKARLVFVLGKVAEEKVMTKIEMEYNHYGDIVQEDFMDSYRNLTYKGIAALKWISNHCRHASFAIKSDDDIMINLFKIVDEIKHSTVNKYGTTNLILCNQWVRMKVLRDENSKWYVPKTEFQPDYFPPYCSGSAFILSVDVCEKMYTASFYTPFFWVDDYYITGALAKAINVKQKRWNDFYMLNGKIVAEILRNNSKNKYAFFHISKLNSIHKMWNNLVRGMKGDLQHTNTTIPKS
ncbi:beta-1,3-galactosyltransferase 1-like [Ostrea edulis]|uniref:beta-1,3-galactosyltransferase 1-like n=1 Tax=Ostrea edulis TaxID=37623 RepID=UPI0024AFDD8D|nr:beta-1,3-galactosyltransferase 1-like [Ostrea edulis]XP_048743625.2 beta-1,3-galactosyltransferase 1-like [Ostrea edulis]XP_048743626.2 beta-1,3-galactosyltransferase 1-like [Ostrea edulis]XP_048743627.2 beta-1,3-galactosyltransferase 1-like [Ostrea edulis]XP_048743628.2 beta-1,3-galactosyltransferase 1-like [Ostrea edulis]